MAEQIDELFVKLGLESDEKEFQQANEQFANLRTNALQFGAALGTVGAAGFGLVNNFAGRTDEIGQFADRMDTSAQFVNELGFALEAMGGSADDAFGSIQTMRDLLQDTDWGRLEGNMEGLSAGIDFEAIRNAESLRDAYTEIASQIQGLDTEKQRRVLEELGFSGEQMNLFMQGSGGMSQLFRRGSELAPVTEDMTENAREFSRALTELTEKTQGISDVVANRLAPAFTQAIEALTGMGGRDDFESAYEAGIEAVSRGPMQMLGELFGGNFGQAAGTGADIWQGATSNIFDKATVVPQGILQMLNDSIPSGGDDPMGAERPDSLPLSPRRGGGEFDVRPDTSMNTGGGNQLNFNIDARGATDPEGVALNVERAVNRTLSRYAENAILDLTGGVS